MSVSLISSQLTIAGRPTYIEPDGRIDEKISTFFARMQSPPAHGCQLDFGSVRIFDVYPG